MRTIPARHVMQIYNSADRNIDSYAGSARRVKHVPRRGFPGGLTTESRAILASPLVVFGDGLATAAEPSSSCRMLPMCQEHTSVHVLTWVLAHPLVMLFITYVCIRTDFLPSYLFSSCRTSCWQCVRNQGFSHTHEHSTHEQEERVLSVFVLILLLHTLRVASYL